MPMPSLGDQFSYRFEAIVPQYKYVTESAVSIQLGYANSAGSRKFIWGIGGGGGGEISGRRLSRSSKG